MREEGSAVKRLVLFVFFPNAVWRELSAHPQPPWRLFNRIVLPFSVVIALAHHVGWTWFDSDWNAAYGYRNEHVFGAAALPLVWLSVLAGPPLMAAILAWLAPWCGGRRDFAAGFNVSTFGTLPLFVTGCFLFFMPMIVACLFAFVYSCWLYAQGARVLLGVPVDESAELLVGTLFVLCVLMSFGSLAVGLLAG
jgi:hypothetical protein